MKKVWVLLIDGFEEMEAVAPIDILRRAKLDVLVVGVESKTIKSSRNLSINADILLSEVQDLPDAIVIPGGAPGAENMGKSTLVVDFIKRMDEQKKLIAVICASPATVLAQHGFLKGKKATCFPGCETLFAKDVQFSEDRVVLDGHILTSRAAGTAVEFALKIVELLKDKATADKISAAILHC